MAGPNSIALSTCWNSYRHDDGYELIKEIADLGFEVVELGHGTRMSLLPGILKALAENLVRVGSTHNFCPLPVGVNSAAPNLYQPSSPDKRELEQWRRYTEKSVDFAYSLGADRMVAHMGSVFFFIGRPDRRLGEARAQRPAEELVDDKHYDKLRARFLKKMRRKSPAHLSRVRACLEAVAGVCNERGFKIGAENREGLLELPLEEEFADFLRSHEDLQFLQGWHDVGHAKLKEQMGFIRQEEFLATYVDKLIGWHLHDVTPEGRDHVELGTGTVDWPMIGRFIDPGKHSIVLELSPALSRKAVSRSLEFAQCLLDGKPLPERKPAGVSIESDA